jgi:hypothetical protein
MFLISDCGTGTSMPVPKGVGLTNWQSGLRFVGLKDGRIKRSPIPDQNAAIGTCHRNNSFYAGWRNRIKKRKIAWFDEPERRQPEMANIFLYRTRFFLLRY